MSDVEDELRQQLRDAFEDASYPVDNQMGLLPALPDGPGTRFEAGDFSMTAMELGSKLSDSQEFPYEDLDALVEDIIAGLKEKDFI
jgi:hypothetical protein